MKRLLIAFLCGLLTSSAYSIGPKGGSSGISQNASNTFTADQTIGGTTPRLTVGDAGEEDADLFFDGNAQDFHIGLDDSADDLVIGVGDALGTTQAIGIDDTGDVTLTNELTVSGAGTHAFSGTLDPTNMAAFTLTGNQTVNTGINISLNGTSALTTTGDDVDIDTHVVVVGNLTANKIVSISTQSSIYCYTGNGHATTDNKIRRFATCTTVGLDVTMSSTAASGQVFTIVTSGWYSVSYCDYATGGAADIGISLNSGNLTTAIASVSAAGKEKLIVASTPAGNKAGMVAVELYLAADDVIRPHTDGVPNATDTNSIFRIERIH